MLFNGTTPFTCCSPGFCCSTITFYSLHYSTQLSCSTALPPLRAVPRGYVLFNGTTPFTCCTPGFCSFQRHYPLYVLYPGVLFFSTALPPLRAVPRGSVLRLLLFTLYTSLLSSVVQPHNLKHQLYADDTHTYLPLANPNTNCSLSQLGIVSMICSTGFLLLVHQCSSVVDLIVFPRHLC